MASPWRHDVRVLLRRSRSRAPRKMRLQHASIWLLDGPGPFVRRGAVGGLWRQTLAGRSCARLGRPPKLMSLVGCVRDQAG